VAASMRRLHEKLGIASPDDEPPSPAPDPTSSHRHPLPTSDTWRDAFFLSIIGRTVALFLGGSLLVLNR
jgi:hypothetical protein